MSTDRSATSPGPARARLRAAVLALVCFLGVFALWRVLVVSLRGQVAEQTALTGSRIGGRFVFEHARNLLHLVSMPSLIALVLSVLVLALWRGSRRRALWAAGVVVVVNVSTQVLKHWILWRPDYGLSQRWDGANTLPSGHTAVAASAAVALVLVCPVRWRPAAAWAGAGTAVATGYSTLAAQWHRPADVLAALLLTVGWGALAVALGAWDESQTASAGLGAAEAEHVARDQEPRTPALLLLALGVLAALVAAPLEWWTWLGAVEEASRADTFVAYLAGTAGTVSVACVCMALLVLLPVPCRRGL